MNIKSLLIAMSISSPVLFAAELLSTDSADASSFIKSIKEIPNSYNSDVKALVQDYLLGEKSVEDLNSYVKALQAEIYELVDAGSYEEANALLESVTAVLDPLYEGMNEVERWSAGEETLSLIVQYKDDLEHLTDIYRTVINTTPVEE